MPKMPSIFLREPWWRRKAMTKAWSSGESLPRGETSNSPSRVSLHLGQASRVTAKGSRQSGQRALEMSMEHSSNKKRIENRINKVKYKINLIKLFQCWN